MKESHLVEIFPMIVKSESKSERQLGILVKRSFTNCKREIVTAGILQEGVPQSNDLIPKRACGN